MFMYKHLPAEKASEAGGRQGPQLYLQVIVDTYLVDYAPCFKTCKHNEVICMLKQGNWLARLVWLHTTK